MGAPMESYVDRKKLLVPGVAGIYEALAPLSYTLIRFSLGVFLIPHGYAKLFQDDAVAASRNFVNFGWSNPLAWAYFIGGRRFLRRLHLGGRPLDPVRPGRLLLRRARPPLSRP